MPRQVRDASPMRHRATLQRPGTGRNEHGEAVQSWADVATVWCSIEPLRGLELWSARQVQPNVTHGVVCRHGPNLTGYSAMWRWVFGRRAFNVEAVTLRNEIGRSFLDWQCIEVADGNLISRVVLGYGTTALGFDGTALGVTR